MNPVVSVFMAGSLWGVINVFVRVLSAAGFSSMQIAGVRMVVAAVCFTSFLLITDKNKLKISLKDLWMFLGTGLVSVVLFNCCYFYTMIHGEASVAVVLLYTSPVFIMLLSAILFGERITRRKMAALALTLCGCVFVSGLAGGQVNIKGVVLVTGVLSGLFYGLYTIFGRYALAKYDSSTVTAYTFIFGLLGSLPISDFGHICGMLIKDPGLILWCLGIGIINTVLPYFLYTYGLSRMESGKAAILVAVEPVVGGVIGICFFGESKSPQKLLGMGLILSAIVLLNLPERRRQ